MPQTVLGLDIGLTSVKAVLLAPKGLTGGRIVDARVLDIEACGGMDGALEMLGRDKSLSGFPCVVCLPSSDIMLRHVNLPFRDEHKIRKTLPFELEQMIPFPIEEVATDYLMIPGHGLLVATMLRQKIRDWIEAVEKNLGEAVVIDAYATALAAQVIKGKNFSGCGIILDIGRQTTTATFYRDESVMDVRSLAIGGGDLTQALARELSVSVDETEQMKCRDEIPATSSAAQDYCRRFSAELKNTVEYMKINGLLQSDPSRILWTGGGSLFTPLRNALENFFSTDSETLDLGQDKRLECAEHIRGALAPPVMNTAIAAALRIPAGRKSFNFRQGEFASSNTSLDTKTQLRRAAVVAAIILALAVVNQAVDYGLKSLQLSGIRKEISRIFGTSFPEAANINESLYVPHLQTKLAELQKTFGAGEGIPEATAADLLKEISGRIPSSLDIVFTDMHYENKVITIKGEAKTMDDVTAVKNDLSKSTFFQDVTLGPTSLAGNANKVDFSLRIDVK